jgi:hypothetical protein
LKRSRGPRPTRDTGQEDSSEPRTFQVETMRWQREIWAVEAQNALEAERRYDMGMADGPISIEDEGAQVVEVKRLR